MRRELLLPRRRRRIKPYLDLTAMIDTVFNLLIFFAVVATLAGFGTKGIPMKLPAAKSAESISQRVVVSLFPDRRPQVNGLEVASKELGQAVGTACHGDAETQIVVMAEKAVPYAQLVRALDEVRLAGYHRIALATAPAPGRK
jgi:biopolymer transport protein ExbD